MEVVIPSARKSGFPNDLPRHCPSAESALPARRNALLLIAPYGSVPLFDLDLGRLDQRPPFRDLGLLMRVERLRVLPFAREDILSDHRELGLHRRIGERLGHRSVELRHDWLRRALGHPESMPQRD